MHRGGQSLDCEHFRGAILALYGVRWQSAGRRSHAATALCPRSATDALGEVSCLTTRSKAASRFALPPQSKRRTTETGMLFPFGGRLCAPQMRQNVQSPESQTVTQRSRLLRIPEYRDETLRPPRNSIDFGSPLPNAGEGLGVRGQALLECSRHGSESSTSTGLRDRLQPAQMPLTSSPWKL